MRDRLIQAAIDALAEDGYGAASLGAIVRRAHVSRGAQSHHYPSKQALLVDVAERLTTVLSRELPALCDGPSGEAVDGTTSPEDRFFFSNAFRAYLELIVAARHEPKIASILRAVWPALCHGTPSGMDPNSKSLRSRLTASGEFLYLCGLGLHLNFLSVPDAPTARAF